MSQNRNVVSLPTKPDATQPWKCTVCGATMEYAQPISLQKCCDLLGAFVAEHEHPEAAADHAALLATNPT